MFLVFYALLNEFYTYNRYDEFDMICCCVMSDVLLCHITSVLLCNVRCVALSHY